MTDEPPPRRASPVMIAFSALVTVYFLYVLLFAAGERPSTLMLVLYWLAVIANLAFLASVVRRWRK